jgi:hypothetical protein
MALHHNPRIVTDGLVILYDPADPNSYPGSGNVLYNLTGNSTYPYVSISGETNYGSISGGVVNMNGESGSTQNGAFLNGPGNLGITVNSNFTSMGWMLRTGVESAEIFDYRGTGQRVSFQITNNALYFIQRENFDGNTILSTGVSVTNTLDEWNHYALVHVGNKWEFYKDGELVGTTTFDLTHTITGGDYSIGISWSDDDYPSNTMDGSMSHMMHYTRALSAEEVKQNYNATKGRVNRLGGINNPATSARQILEEFPDSSNGLYWIKSDSAPPQQVYCDMDNGGWMLVASNDARDALIPGGTGRNTQEYFLNRPESLGVPSPNKDYIIGSLIEALEFTQVRIFGWGYGFTNNSFSWPSNLGDYIIAEWSLTTDGPERLTEIVPRANVTLSGNSTISPNANYFILDAVQNDIDFNANRDQSTLGGAGVQSATGDPSQGCYLGHGLVEGSFEGWYDGSNVRRDSQGYTTWVK